MKKLVCFSLIVFCMLFLNSVCNAEPLENIDVEAKTIELTETLEEIKGNNELNTDIVNIVSGLDNTYEPTFDTYRIISGEARQGTEVSIWKYNKEEERVSLREITIHKIGASETFFDLIELNLGKNYVMVQGKYEEQETAKEYCLNRKNVEIKEKLKAMPLLFNYSKMGIGFLR